MRITDVYLVYNDEAQIKEIGGTYTLKVSPFFHFINYNNRKTKKEAWALMNHWGSQKVPFAIVFNNDDPIKAFYSEADDNIIKSLINFLNE